MEQNKRKIRIRMAGSYEQFFAKDKQKHFVRDLCSLTGVTEDSLSDIVFRKGCIIAELMLPEEAAERLKEAYALRNKNCSDPDIEELKKFMKDYCVVEITDDFKVRINIRTDSKTERKVVFVHGWRGGSNSFGEMPQMLSKKLGCDSIVYQYPSGIWQRSPEINYISKNLDNWIRNNVGKANLAIICHSMGGIVARNMLILEGWRENKLGDQVKQLTLVASPHSGVPFAKLIKHVPILQKAQIADMSTDSPFLVNLNNQWSEWRNHEASNDCYIRTIYGTSDKVVDVTLAIGDDPQAVPILNAGHIDIVKPKEENPEIVETIAHFIEKSSF